MKDHWGINRHQKATDTEVLGVCDARGFNSESEWTTKYILGSGNQGGSDLRDSASLKDTAESPSPAFECIKDVKLQPTMRFTTHPTEAFNVCSDIIEVRSSFDRRRGDSDDKDAIVAGWSRHSTRPFDPDVQRVATGSLRYSTIR